MEVVWARHLDEVRQAQRLRYDVFVTEMGARLKSPLRAMTSMSSMTIASIFWCVIAAQGRPSEPTAC